MHDSPNPLNASSLQDASPSDRKAYHAPTLRRYGSIQELTLTNTESNPEFQPDGGNFPTVYAS